MKARPILFSGAMVRAILDEDAPKEQTRRTVRAGNSLVDGVASPALFKSLDLASPRVWVDPGPSPVGNQGPYLKVPNVDGERVHRVYSRVQPGDQLWVRESFATESDDMGIADSVCHYRADFVQRYGAWEQDVAHDAVFRWEHPWRPSIHMPRWASRITLEVTSVRVERVQDISEEDARAEGISAKRLPLAGASGSTVYHAGEWPTPVCGDTARGAFKALWESINGAGSWAADPWVWVVGFKRVEAA